MQILEGHARNPRFHSTVGKAMRRTESRKDTLQIKETGLDNEKDMGRERGKGGSSDEALSLGMYFFELK